MQAGVRGRARNAGRARTGALARWAVAGVIVSAGVLGSGRDAGAQPCQVFGFVSCPGPPAPPATATAREVASSSTHGARGTDAPRGRAVAARRGQLRRVRHPVRAGDGAAGRRRERRRARSHEDATPIDDDGDRLRSPEVDPNGRSRRGVEHAASGRGALWLDGDTVLTGVFSASSSAPLAPAHMGGHPATRGALDRSPRAARGFAGPARAPRVTAAPRVAGRLAPRRLQLAFGVGAVALGLLALAIRWVWHPGASRANSIPELVPSASALESDEAVCVDDAAPNSLRHHLRSIDSWARILDDGWPTLAESDKRIAVQIILRNTRAAIDELREPSLTA